MITYNVKNREVCNKTRSVPASLLFKGQGTKHTTVNLRFLRFSPIFSGISVSLTLKLKNLKLSTNLNVFNKNTKHATRCISTVIQMINAFFFEFPKNFRKLLRIPKNSPERIIFVTSPTRYNLPEAVR